MCVDMENGVTTDNEDLGGDVAEESEGEEATSAATATGGVGAGAGAGAAGLGAAMAGATGAQGETATAADGGDDGGKADCSWTGLKEALNKESERVLLA
jgi:hypothetical protein